MSTRSLSVDGNVALPPNDSMSLKKGQTNNGYGWDADSAVGGFDEGVPE